MTEDEKPWVIRDVPERVRRRVKAFAASQGITIAEALEYLVNDGLRANNAEITDALPKFKREDTEQ